MERVTATTASGPSSAVLKSLLEQERVLTPLIRECGEAFWSIAPKMNRALAEYDAGDAGAADLGARARRAWEAILQRTIALRKASQLALREIQIALPAEARSEFQAIAKRSIFPELYPDPTCLLQDLDVHIAGQSGKRAAQFVSLRDAYQVDYAAMCERLGSVSK